jgi:hypothetical protein
MEMAKVVVNLTFFSSEVSNYGVTERSKYVQEHVKSEMLKSLWENTIRMGIRVGDYRW